MEGEARAGARPQRPPLVRPGDGRLLTGVAAGVAAHLGFPVRGVRLALVLVTALVGAGAVGYLLLWASVPEAPDRPAGDADDRGATSRAPRPRRLVADGETGVGRMSRVGGTARLRRAPAGGTELALHLPVARSGSFPHEQADRR